MRRADGEAPWTPGETRSWSEPDSLGATPWDALMRGPQPAGSVLAVFDLTPPGRLTLDEAREAATVLRLQAAEFAEHVLPIYNRMSPNIDSLKKIINATKLFAVGHLSAAQLNDTTVAVRDERFGGANGEVLASVLSAALLEQKGAVAEDVAWFCAYLAAYCARTAAAEAGEWTPEFEAYVGESLAVRALA